MPRSTEIVGEKTNSTGLIIHRIIAYVVLVHRQVSDGILTTSSQQTSRTFSAVQQP